MPLPSYIFEQAALMAARFSRSMRVLDIAAQPPISFRHNQEGKFK